MWKSITASPPKKTPWHFFHQPPPMIQSSLPSTINLTFNAESIFMKSFSFSNLCIWFHTNISPTALGSLQILTHLLFTLNPVNWVYYSHPDLTDEEMVAHRHWVTCPRSHGQVNGSQDSHLNSGFLSPCPILHPNASHLLP